MKQFFKMMFASALGMFVALGIVIFIFFMSLIGMISSMSSQSTFIPSPNSVYKISLTGAITDIDTENPLAMLMGETGQSVSLKTLIESIEKAKNNNNIQGIYLEAGDLSTGTANRQALRRALLDFKESGKFIVAYADTYTQGNYYICSVADKVFLNPQGILSLTGMASQTMFFKGLMEKIGFEFEIFKVGTYKGAVEPFMLNKLSDANREQINSYVTSIWDNIQSGIAETRNITLNDINHFANEGLFFSDPQKTVECGFIDELKYQKEAEYYVKELAGQSGKSLKTIETNKVRNIRNAKKLRGEQIAILYAEGEIVSESETTPYNSESRITEKIAEELSRLKNDESIKAVVLRVNSPGGSAFVSEQIWSQVKEMKKEKPIVVSMGSMAASGGYYISCAADKIIAEPTTLTGSIGIFGMFPNATEAMKKIGVSTDVVKTNKYADLGDMSRPFTNDERYLVQAYVDRGYDLFISRCAEGREMSKGQINEIGQGRVWTGEQALNIGLVDQLGGLELAIKEAAQLAGLTDYYTTDYSTTTDIFQELFMKQLEGIKMNITKEVLGSDFEYVKALKDIRSISGIQARIPYNMKPL